MSENFSNRYQALVAAGKIEADPAQAELVRAMTALERRLTEHRLAQKSSSLGWLFGKREKQRPLLKGLYVYGEVGRGKTMLMDLFFNSVAVRRKRRAHFHEFMADVHERVHTYRQEAKTGSNGPDPIQRAAAAIAEESWLLCFDEFHVTDIADAMILGRLFTKLFELGVVVVATSNQAPNNLYKDGLNRALFLPFIELLQKYCEVTRLDSRVDFRLEKLTGVPTWYVPPDEKAKAALDDAWQRLADGHGAAHELVVKGHVIRVPMAAMGVARFAFEDLCARPLAASDFLKIAHEFHTLIIDHIPVMDFARRNEAKRFIILVDTLYDHAVKLLASAEAQPDHLYTGTEGYEANEFKRTASRLIEMRSQAYLGLPHGPRQGVAWSEKIVET
ncbi:AFG1 family ATPase [Pseudolabrys taiwanensis]|uniref:AFG1 family ATPase n=1 Tax=Pseudolabrys taiwanensis TaxID=331696 RepID=A0A346A0A9_9HYPH|nr:cell division protein ZapE [Pseudolabrys taiwanensis]AXK82606.1 AFG1 family ATPase [Pseudolabrys taiwanensis]